MQIIKTNENSFSIGNTIFPAGLYEISLIKFYTPNKIQITSTSSSRNVIFQSAYNQVELNGVVYGSGQALFDAFFSLPAFSTNTYTLPDSQQEKLDKAGKIETMSDQNFPSESGGIPLQGGNLSTNEAVRTGILLPISVPNSWVVPSLFTPYVMVRLNYVENAVLFLPKPTYYGGGWSKFISEYFRNNMLTITNNERSIYDVKIISSGYQINQNTGAKVDKIIPIVNIGYTVINNFGVDGSSILGIALVPGSSISLKWSNSRQEWEIQ